MKTVLFLNHPQKQCGVHQYGRMTADALARSKRYRFSYLEAETEVDLQRALSSCDGLAAVIFNYCGSVMHWLRDETVAWLDSVAPVAALAHDECCGLPHMRWHIHIDPSHPECAGHMTIGRPVPEYRSSEPVPEETTIGSFGFAFRNHAHLLRLVNEQFDRCKVRLNIPYAYFGDVDGQQARKQAEACRQLAKPGIELEITHDFMAQDVLLDWLAGNTLNAFIYDVNYGRGPASTTDMALAVPRPLAVNASWQFRHLPASVMRVERHSLREIIANGPPKHPWGPEATCADYERAVDVMLGERSQWK